MGGNGIRIRDIISHLLLCKTKLWNPLIMSCSISLLSFGLYDFVLLIFVHLSLVLLPLHFCPSFGLFWKNTSIPTQCVVPIPIMWDEWCWRNFAGSFQAVALVFWLISRAHVLLSEGEISEKNFVLTVIPGGDHHQLLLMLPRRHPHSCSVCDADAESAS